MLAKRFPIYIQKQILAKYCKKKKTSLLMIKKTLQILTKNLIHIN